MACAFRRVLGASALVALFGLASTLTAKAEETFVTPAEMTPETLKALQMRESVISLVDVNMHSFTGSAVPYHTPVPYYDGVAAKSLMMEPGSHADKKPEVPATAVYLLPEPYDGIDFSARLFRSPTDRNCDPGKNQWTVEFARGTLTTEGDIVWETPEVKKSTGGKPQQFLAKMTGYAAAKLTVREGDDHDNACDAIVIADPILYKTPSK